MNAIIGVILAACSPHGFELKWFSIDCGGGVSYEGDWDLDGVIGQPGAGAAMQGGDFSLVGGFLHTPATTAAGADFNGDGAVDFFDYLAFVETWHEGSARADLNRDGVVDQLDYLEFLREYDAGG